MKICIDLLSEKNSERIFGLNLCLFSTHFQFPFFLSPGNLQDGVSLSQVQIGGRLAYFYKILHYFSVFFTVFFNVCQYFSVFNRKDGVSPKCKLEGGSTAVFKILQYFSIFYSIFHHCSEFFSIFQYCSVFAVFFSIFKKRQRLSTANWREVRPLFTGNVVKGRIVKPFVSIYIISASPRTTEILQRVHRMHKRKFSIFFKYESCFFSENTRCVILIVVVDLEMGLNFVFSS